MRQQLSDITDAIQRSRLRLLRMHYESQVGHIGGNLSALDLLVCLHSAILGPDDHFLLSKGHAAGALYVALWASGRLSDDDLNQFHRDGTLLSAHPPPFGIPGVLFATGSLGHGIGLGAGLALARKLKGLPGHVYVLTSDGEWNEGSSWEAIIFAQHQQLSNLTVIVDQNGLQGFGSTREVADLAPLEDKFRAFGLETAQIDGHDPAAIMSILAERGPKLRAIVARTRKGCGVSFMEGKMEWHYLPIDAEQYRQAVHEITSRASGVDA